MMLNDQSKPSDAVSQRYVEFEKVAFEELFGIETIYLISLSRAMPTP